MDLFIGVEIGGTKQQLALGTKEGRLVYEISEKIAIDNGAADILRWLEIKIPLLFAKAKEQNDRVAAIGVGFGGPLETATGRVLCSIQVDGWKDFELKTWLEAKFKLPAYVVVDTVAGGYAEYKYGSGMGSKVFFYSNIGSGIGGMLVIDGKYYDGIGYSAGYIGHTYIPDWTDSRKGMHSKVENICSGWAIERRLQSPGYVPVSSGLTAMCGGDTARLTCGMLGEAAKNGDDFAKAEIGRIAWSYSLGLSNVITLLGSDRISIGGGVANLGEILLRPIRKYTDELVFVASKDRYKIVQCSFMDENVIVGAVAYAADQFEAQS